MARMDTPASWSRGAPSRRRSGGAGGRNAGAVAALAAELGRDYRSFALDDAAALVRALSGVRVVLNCAGPFSRTAAPLVAACLRGRAHYLDITGEVAVLEALAARDAEARAAGIALLPGAGFDVVPSDCLAAHVARRLPSATHLALAFSAGTRMSRGTALTTIETRIGWAGAREGTGARAERLADARDRLRAGAGHAPAITIPWGDVATAYHTTGIPNIEVYVAVPLAVRAGSARRARSDRCSPAGAVKRALAARVRRGPAGPTAAERARRSATCGRRRAMPPATSPLRACAPPRATS